MDHLLVSSSMGQGRWLLANWVAGMGVLKGDGCAQAQCTFYWLALRGSAPSSLTAWTGCGPHHPDRPNIYALPMARWLVNYAPFGIVERVHKQWYIRVRGWPGKMRCMGASCMPAGDMLAKTSLCATLQPHSRTLVSPHTHVAHCCPPRWSPSLAPA